MKTEKIAETVGHLAIGAATSLAVAFVGGSIINKSKNGSATVSGAPMTAALLGFAAMGGAVFLAERHPWIAGGLFTGGAGIEAVLMNNLVQHTPAGSISALGGRKIGGALAGLLTSKTIGNGWG